jgi:hypothetical protein
MQTLFGEEKKKNLLSSGLGMVGRNKRYIFWFWLLNLTLAEFGTAAFRRSAHAMLDHSLYAGGLVHGFDVAVFGELLAHPRFGEMSAMSMPAVYFSVVFFMFSALFLPGVFAGYAATYRLPREDFFRACGRNLWRFIRILIIAGIVMGIVSGILFSINGAIAKKAAESTNEVLPFELRMTGLFIIFLIMTTLRIWFDLSEADTVLSDRRAVRKSIGASFRHTFRSIGRLLGSYVLITIVAAIILVGGIWIWNKYVPAQSIVRAFILAQAILFLLLIPRFWQRGVAVSYWEQKMNPPLVPVEPVPPEPVSPVAIAPVTPEAPPAVG